MNISKISLSNKKDKYALVDNNNSHLSEWKWEYHSSGYATRKFQREKNVQRVIFLHHCIVGYPLNGLTTDHIDGNRLNNCKNNLRIVTVRENALNNRRRREGKTSSKFIGVYWDKYNKNWEVRMRIRGKLKFLGRYDSEKKASQKYISMRKKLGEL